MHRRTFESESMIRLKPSVSTRDLQLKLEGNLKETAPLGQPLF